jgi:hypothetical protein
MILRIRTDRGARRSPPPMLPTVSGVLAACLVASGCSAPGVSAPSSLAPGSAAPSASAPATSPSQAEPTSSPACEPGDDGAFQLSQVVPATANIFGAGRDQAPAPGGGGAGTVPPVWELPSGSTIVTFPCATGEVTPFSGQSLRNGPAGDTRGAGGESTDVTSYQGISGIVNRGNGMFLVGVFLTDDPPADPAPERLDFSDNEDFDLLEPLIGQTFFIGDGGGRRFAVPDTATRLFLGFADAFLYQGAPGYYGNNSGELEVTVNVAVE